MKKLNYYYLKPPVEPKDMGVKKEKQINDFVIANYNKREYWDKYQKMHFFDFINTDDIDLNIFKLQPGARLTPILSSMFLNSFGLFLNDEVLGLFKQHKAYKANYHDIILTQNSKKVYWHYMQLLSSSKDLLDYAASEFATDEVLPFKRSQTSYEIKKVKDYEDFNKIDAEIRNQENINRSLQLRRVILKEAYDIVVLPFQVTVFVSERLMKKLKESKLIKWDTLEEFTNYDIFVA